MGRLFGTNGVRGVVGQTMDAAFALRMGQAVGTWLPVGATVAVGRDPRRSGPMLQAAFAAGLHSTGVHTVDLGMVPSPAVQWTVKQGGYALGAILTASHNPPDYNGIKLIANDGTETDAGQEAEVEALYFGKQFRVATWDAVGGSKGSLDAAAGYVQAVLKTVDVAAIQAARLRVVFDPGGGAGCRTGLALLEALGVQVVPLATDPDPLFSSRPSEPTPENAAACMAAVVANEADLGILQDGDADRAVFVDEHGVYVWGDQALALVAFHELARHPKGGLVVTTVASSSCVTDMVERAGGTVRTTVVGSPIVAREMIEHGAVFGGEENGGFLFARHQVCRDGLMAIAFMLELLATSKRTLSRLVDEVPRYALCKAKVKVPEDAKDRLQARVREAVDGMAGVRQVDDRDGVKVFLADGWVLVRPSGTEPLMRIQSEAQDDETARQLADRFRDLLSGLVGP